MKTIVLSLGGSLIAPNEIDTLFLKRFREVILNFVDKGNKVIIVCGGGRTCRNYQNAANDVTKCSNDDLDWIGIAATKLNAELLRVILNENSYNSVVPDFNTKGIKSNIIVGSGHLPGSSSDYDAVMWAKNYKADYVVNLCDVDYIYDKDPKLPGAKPLPELTWKDMQKIVGTKWVAGSQFPFDPIATKMAAKSKLKLVFLNGRNTDNLKDFLDGKEFVGSVVH